jgi:hypothetical protein
VRWDEPDYLILARNLLRGDGYQIFGVPDLVWPPGAPVLAALSLAAGVSVDKGLVLWHVVLGAVSCGLLYGLSREVTGNGRLAAIAGLLASVSPTLAVWPLYWGSLTEPVFLALLLAGLWATWRLFQGGGPLAGLLAGLSFGASYLVRTEGLFWWGVLLLVALGLAVYRRRGWGTIAVYALGFLVVAAPYVGYLYRHTGQLMVSGKTGIVLLVSPQVTQYGGIGQDYTARLDSTGTEILWLSPEQFEISWLDVVLADPRGMVRQVQRNLALAQQALVDPLLGLGLVALAVLGFFGTAWGRRRWRGELFWLAALLPLGILFISKVETSYLVPMVPVAMVWAARGMVHLSRWAESTLPPLGPRQLSAATWSLIILALLSAGGLWGQVEVARTGQAGLIPSHKVAGRWLADHSEPGEPVMSRNSELGLYADRPLVAFPNAGWGEVLAYARARGARYLVTDDWELTQLRPQLSFLLDPIQAPDELEHLATFVGPRRTTLVYRIR